MAVFDWTFFIITLASFAAAVLNASMSTGGVYILLIAVTSVLPISVAIPLHSTFSIASLISRVVLFWKHIQWRIFLHFLLGAIFGVYLGVYIFFSLPENLVSLLLGILILLVTWAPYQKIPLKLKRPFILIGVTHSFLGAMFGVGAILQPYMARTKILKLQLTGTVALCMLTLDFFKISGYISFGYEYLPYVPMIIGASLAGFLGTLVGKKLTGLITEQTHRKLLKILLTFVGLKFLLSAVWESYQLF